MYIWIASDISVAYESIRRKCIEYNREIGLNELAFMLPQHISLKISFEVENSIAPRVIDDVSQYLSNNAPFTVGKPSAQIFGNILWLRFPYNESLERLHSELDDLLAKKYGIPQHAFDRDFVFHSTLFIDDDAISLEEMLRKAMNLEYPECTVDRFIIGSSDSGRAGTYSVIKLIEAK